MTNNTKLDEKLEGAENFRAWKYKIMLILEEHDLDGFIKEEVKEPVIPKVEPRLRDSSLRKSCLKMYKSNEIKLKR